MPEQNEKTFESTILDRNPEVRDKVLGSKDFHEWKNALPSVVVDDIKYYIRGGDMLKDEEQLIFEWAHRSGLLSLEA
jgi:hypothetical protein